MNSTRDDQPLPELEEVRKAYRDAGFNDEPPAHVDAFIRAAAKRESKRNLNDYLPSLAMAATVVLALGLVLRLTLPGRDLVAPTAVPTAQDAAAPRLRVQEQAAPLEDIAAPAAAIVPVAADAAEQGLQERAEQLEEVVAPARAGAPAAADTPIAASAPTAAGALEREGVASSAIGRMAAPASVPCTTAERSDADLWLACIAAQIDAELLDAARSELEEFRLAFADYPVPVNIAQALEP
ncbi:MAG: hypothetical protein OEQ25_00180 [Gammaproteobacteria bacterium]|nr:hypothetical protein [Gammaproteobacteria bacterium]MDH3505528.1 hypothetical protein [Gammaproteobacteria bacterium]